MLSDLFSLNIGHCTVLFILLTFLTECRKDRKGRELCICRTGTIGMTAVDDILFHLIAVSSDLLMMPRSTGRAELHHPEPP